MGAPLELAGALKRTEKGNADFYYGGGDYAWTNTAAACAGVPLAIRPGKTVGIIENGKVVEYVWHADDLSDGGLIKKMADIDMNGINQVITERLKDYAKVPDGLQSADVSQASNVLTIVNAAWRINGVTYNDPSPQIFNIVPAKAGYHRIDLIVGDTNNGLQLIKGIEDSVVGVRPQVPAGTVEITNIVVSDAGLGQVTNNDYGFALNRVVPIWPGMSIDFYSPLWGNQAHTVFHCYYGRADFPQVTSQGGPEGFYWIGTVIRSITTGTGRMEISQWNTELQRVENKFERTKDDTQFNWGAWTRIMLETNMPEVLADNITDNDNTFTGRNDFNGGIYKNGKEVAALEEALTLSDAQKAALTPGVTYLAAVIKDPQSQVTGLDATIQSIDLFSPLDENILADPNGWGNEPGKNSEYKRFSGLNTTGQLGRAAQMKVINGTVYVCVSHQLGTDASNGYALYARNRSVNFLDPTTNAADALIASQLQTESRYDSSSQMAGIDYKSTPGVMWVPPTGGYLYVCVATTSISSIWNRQAFSTNYRPMSINTGTHPNLVSHLNAHDFTTGSYAEGSDSTNGNDELAFQGQSYWTANYKYEKNDSGKWARIAINQ
jgi:hypothetical protein